MQYAELSCTAQYCVRLYCVLQTPLYLGAFSCVVCRLELYCTMYCVGLYCVVKTLLYIGALSSVVCRLELYCTVNCGGLYCFLKTLLYLSALSIVVCCVEWHCIVQHIVLYCIVKTPLNLGALNIVVCCVALHIVLCCKDAALPRCVVLSGTVQWYPDPIETPYFHSVHPESTDVQSSGYSVVLRSGMLYCAFRRFSGGTFSSTSARLVVWGCSVQFHCCILLFEFRSLKR